MAGSIELILGPMFSGKTTELISRTQRAALAGQAVVVVRFQGDTRSPLGEVSTHAGARQGSTPASGETGPIRIVTAGSLGEVEFARESAEAVVGVDEGQFFPDLPEVCDRWARAGRRVIVAALDADAARRPFGRVGDLVPLCERIEKRDGVCMDCRARPSAFTRRQTGGAPPPALARELAPTVAGIRVDIGGRELYRSVCRECWLAHGPPVIQENPMQENSRELKGEPGEEPTPKIHMAETQQTDWGDLKVHVKRALAERVRLFGDAVKAIRAHSAEQLERCLNDALPTTGEDRVIATTLSELGSTPEAFLAFLSDTSRLGLVLFQGVPAEITAALTAHEFDIWRAGDGRLRVTRKRADGALAPAGPVVPSLGLAGRRGSLGKGRHSAVMDARPRRERWNEEGRPGEQRKSGIPRAPQFPLGLAPRGEDRPPSANSHGSRRRRRGRRAGRHNVGMGIEQQLKIATEMKRDAAGRDAEGGSGRYAGEELPRSTATKTVQAREPGPPLQGSSEAPDSGGPPRADLGEAARQPNGATAGPSPGAPEGGKSPTKEPTTKQMRGVQLISKESWADLADAEDDPVPDPEPEPEPKARDSSYAAVTRRAFTSPPRPGKTRDKAP